MNEGSLIYFIKSGDAIKIGYSTNLAGRLRALSTMQPEPFTVVAVKLGGQAEEAALHRKLKAHRINGEWFRDCDEVRAAMDGLLVEITPEAKPRKPRVKRMIHYTPPPQNPWFVLSGRMKKLDDASVALGVPREKGLELLAAMKEFAGLFERSLDDRGPQLLSAATELVQRTETQMAA